MSKYSCGCGKVYSSYPAFSTHKKLKHNNEEVVGTHFPNSRSTKRGRPSYEFKKVPKPGPKNEGFYQGLTIIELGLLRLDEKYPHKIISDASQENDYDLPELSGSECTSPILGLIMANFLSMITKHMNRNPAYATIAYISRLITYLLTPQQTFRIEIINDFFANATQYEHIKRILSDCGLKLDFLVEVSIIFSEWLSGTGYTDRTLQRRVTSKLVEGALP